MIIYTNGCSHTAGHHMERSKTWPYIIIKSIVGDDKFSVNVPPSILKRNTNVLYNESIHGAGNDYIFHKSLETIGGLLNTSNKPDYVFIQWSGPNRRMHSNIDGGYVFVNPHDNTELGVKFEPMGSEHTLHYMFSMQEILKSNDIEYFFFNYMGVDKVIKKSSIYPKLDLSRILNFNSNINIFDGLIDFIKSNNMNCDDMGHPNDMGNYFIANHIIEKLGYKCIGYSQFFENYNKVKNLTQLL